MTLDNDVAQRATDAFRIDLANSKRVTNEDIDRVSFLSRTIDAGAYWVRSQL